jgi:hypothetical protein
MKGPHSNKASIPLCIQKQLCKDIEERGGLAAILKSKNGALTSSILSKRPDIYGHAQSQRRIQVTSKIGDWKRLFKQGSYQDIVDSLLNEQQGDEESEDSLVESDDDDSHNEDTPPPTKTPVKQKTPKETPKKSPKKSQARSPAKPAPKTPSAPKTPKKKIVNNPSPSPSPPPTPPRTTVPMAEDMLLKNSIMSLKDQIGESCGRTTNHSLTIFASPTICASTTEHADKHTVDCEAFSFVPPFVVGPFRDKMVGDRLVEGVRIWLDVDPCEYFKGAYKMWWLDEQKLLVKYLAVSPDLFEWEQAAYNAASRRRSMRQQSQLPYDEAIERQAAVGRQRLAAQEHEATRFVILKFARVLDNKTFKATPAVGQVLNDLQNREVRASLTVFELSKPMVLSATKTLTDTKKVTRIEWIVAFAPLGNDRYGRPVEELSAEAALLELYEDEFAG